MTIRIDSAHKSPGDDRWMFSIKGLYGCGIYATLHTDERGSGLQVLNRDADLGWIRRQYGIAAPAQVFAADAFRIPPGADTQEATRIFADALLQYGWGPLVNQANQVIRAADSVPSAISRGRKSGFNPAP